MAEGSIASLSLRGDHRLAGREGLGLVHHALRGQLVEWGASRGDLGGMLADVAHRKSRQKRGVSVHFSFPNPFF